MKPVVFHGDIERHSKGYRESHAELPSDEMPGRSGPTPWKVRSPKESDIGYRTIFERAEQDVANRPVNRRGLGEVQDVDEIVPARIDEDGMLVGLEPVELAAVQTEVAVEFVHLAP